MVVFRFTSVKIPMDHRVGDSVSLHHPTPSDFALTDLPGSGIGQWGFFFLFNHPALYGKVFSGRVCCGRTYSTHPSLPSLTLGAGLVSGGFLFLGIGFALVKQLVGVDIECTLLARPHRLLSTMCRWGFSFPPLNATHLPE